VLPLEEPMLRGLVGELYGLDGPCSAETLAEIAEPWRPFRTWASVLVRAASGRLEREDESREER
jgi:DNA-3-methyladenine glycosylase II